MHTHVCYYKFAGVAAAVAAPAFGLTFGCERIHEVLLLLCYCCCFNISFLVVFFPNFVNKNLLSHPDNDIRLIKVHQIGLKNIYACRLIVRCALHGAIVLIWNSCRAWGNFGLLCTEYNENKTKKKCYKKSSVWLFDVYAWNELWFVVVWYFGLLCFIFCWSWPGGKRQWERWATATTNATKPLSNSTKSKCIAAPLQSYRRSLSVSAWTEHTAQLDLKSMMLTILSFHWALCAIFHQ